MGPPTLAKRFEQCSYWGLEFRGESDRRQNNRNSGCLHRDGVYGEILFFVDLSAYGHTSAPKRLFARVNWFQDVDLKQSSYIKKVSKHISSAKMKAFNREHRFVPGRSTTVQVHYTTD